MSCKRRGGGRWDNNPQPSGIFWDDFHPDSKDFNKTNKHFKIKSENTNVRVDRVVNSAICGSWTDLY